MHLSIEWAREQAESLVKPLGRRWVHVQAVAACAEDLADRLGLDRGVLVSAAWLHDIGYAPEVAQSGFHPLDGARHLRALNVDERLVSLVGHHSCARFEAAERGIAEEFAAELPRPQKDYEDALCFADMTRGPAGDPVEVTDRVDEIRERYGRGDVVTRFVDAAESEILASVRRVEKRLRASESRALIR